MGDLKSGRRMEEQEKKRRIVEVQALYRSCNTISEQKCLLASQAYEMIDKHICKLDTELARFEGELLQQQREQLNPSSVGATPQLKGSQQSSSGMKKGGDKEGGRGNQKGSAHSSQKYSSANSNSVSGETNKRKRKNEATNDAGSSYKGNRDASTSGSHHPSASQGPSYGS